MNRIKAQEILEVYGKPKIKVGKGNITFTRQTEADLIEIESKTNQELIEQWKSLVWMNMIYQQISMNEMQRISLLELEMHDRKIPTDPLKLWYEEASAEFNNRDL